MVGFRFRYFLRALAIVVSGLALGVALAGPAAAADSGYTPTSTPVSTPPPATTCPAGAVVSSTTVSAAGGSVTGTVDGTVVTVNVPAGAFPDGAEVAIIDTSGIAVAPAGDSIVLAFGITFCVNGQKFQGTFSPPATVTISNPAIKPGQSFYQQVGSTLIPIQAQISNGSLTFTIDSDPDFVLVASTTTAALIPGATSVVTGKPFLLEGLVAAGLAAVGGTLLFLRLRLRLRPRHR